MKGFKNLRLPNWIIKNIQYGKEEADLSSILVNIGVFYLLGLITFFVYSPFNSEYLAIEIICAIGVLLSLIMLGLWLIRQVSLLNSLRKEAIKVYRDSKSEKEIREASSRLKKLYVPIPDAA